MFADNRNLFFSHSGIKKKKKKMSKELTNASNWFKAIIKCYVFFNIKKDNILLRLPNPNINWLIVELESSVIVLGVWIGGSFTCR